MRRKTKAPTDIAVAALDMAALTSWAAAISQICGTTVGSACVVVPPRSDEPTCVWVAPRYGAYRRAWLLAQQQGLVDPLEDYGEWVDVDHLCARSWAIEAGLGWVRLFPVWAEVNRSAGAGREKSLLGRDPAMALSRRAGVLFAGELQIMKIIGHPVGTASEPELLW